MQRPVLTLTVLGSALVAAAAAQSSTRLSLGVTGAEGNNISYSVRLSDDARFAVFETHATNLIPGDSNGNKDVLVRDLVLETTAVISVNSAGAQGSAGTGSHMPDISADGRYVVFHSFAPNFGSIGDATGVADIFLRDRDPDANGIYDESNSTTVQVSIDAFGTQPNGGSLGPEISDDGSVVAFESAASDLVVPATPGGGIFARVLSGTDNELVSVDVFGLAATGFLQDLSLDGRFVLFWSNDPDLVLGDTNARADAFVRDRLLGTTTRISVSDSEAQSNHDTTVCQMSSDGRYVAFFSKATNLVAGSGPDWGIFLRDRDPDVDGVYDEANATTELVSINSFEVQTLGAIDSTYPPSVSDDGRYVAFTGGDSSGPCCDLVTEDVNGSFDVFLRDRTRGETTRLSVDGDGKVNGVKSWGPQLSSDGSVCAFSTWSWLVPEDLNTHEDIYVRDQRVWRDYGWNMVGSWGGSKNSVPVISAHGDLDPSSTNHVKVVQAKKGSLGYLVIGLSELNVPLLGGRLLPFPSLVQYGLPISSVGSAEFGDWSASFTLAGDTPAGLELWLQMWVLDAAGSFGVVSSNAIRGVTQ
jgi:Tol biopolymer transport system component